MSIFYDEDTALTPPQNESFTRGERTDFIDNSSKAFNALEDLSYYFSWNETTRKKNI